MSAETMQCVAAGSVVDRAFKDYDFKDPKTKHDGVYYQCACVRDIPPRDEMWEYEREIGMAFLDDIFNLKKHNRLEAGITLLFMFPERWLSIREQQCFVHALGEYQKKFKIRFKMVQIVTSSPLIVGDFHREQVRIVRYDDSKKLSRVVQEAGG